MATRAAMSPAEYLSTSFEHDRDYVRGEVLERPMPVFRHGRIQGRLFSYFDRFEKTHGLFASIEQRMHLAEDIVRIADVAIFAAEPDPVPSEPPLAVIEVLSAGDRWSDLMEKLGEYRAWGVPNIWLVDVDRRELLIYRDGDIIRMDSLRLQGYPVEIRFSDLE